MKKLTYTKTFRACLAIGVLAVAFTAAGGPGFAAAQVERAQRVLVINGDLSPVPTRAVAPVQTTEVGEPFQHTVLRTLLSAHGSFDEAVEIPEGKVLLVQYVSIWSSGDDPLDRVEIRDGDSTTRIHLRVERAGPSGVASELVQLALGSPVVSGYRDFAADRGPTTVLVTIRGMLIDAAVSGVS